MNSTFPSQANSFGENSQNYSLIQHYAIQIHSQTIKDLQLMRQPHYYLLMRCRGQLTQGTPSAAHKSAGFVVLYILQHSPLNNRFYQHFELTLQAPYRYFCVPVSRCCDIPCHHTPSNCTAFCTPSQPMLTSPATRGIFCPSAFILLQLDPCFHHLCIFHVCHRRNLTIKCPFPSYCALPAPLPSSSALFLQAGVQALALTRVPGERWLGWGCASLGALALAMGAHNLGRFIRGQCVAVHHFCHGDHPPAGCCALW